MRRALEAKQAVIEWLRSERDAARSERDEAQALFSAIEEGLQPSGGGPPPPTAHHGGAPSVAVGFV